MGGRCIRKTTKGIRGMIKYVNTQLGFREFPDEVALLINISNCPNNCPGCHSSYLAQDIGEVLDEQALDNLIEEYSGITCIGFMGGDNDHLTLNRLVKYIKLKYNLNTGWYSGKQYISLSHEDLMHFNYIKVGPYIEEFGPLDNPNTNQRMYKVEDGEMIDITNKFWRND